MAFSNSLAAFEPKDKKEEIIHAERVQHFFSNRVGSGSPISERAYLQCYGGWYGSALS